MKRYPPKPTLLPELGNTKYKTVAKVTIVPEIESLFMDFKAIISVELARLKKKLAMAQEMNSKDVASLNKCTETLIKLSKEQRERDAAFNPDNLSDEEYLEVLEDAVGALREKIEEKKQATEGNDNESSTDNPK